MRLVLFLIVGSFVASVKAADDLNASPSQIVIENSLAAGYNAVIYIGDTYKNLPAEFRSIEDAITAFHAVINITYLILL